MAGPAEGRIRHPVLRAFVRAPGGLIGAGLLLGLLVLAVVGPLIWGHQATVTDLNVPYQVHSPEHPLGTDSLGRDVLARTLSATRLTLVLGLSAAAISAVVGFGIGTAVAALGPRARGIGRRAIESSLSFPPILLALFLVAIIGAGARGAVIAIGLGAAPGFARLAENFATSVGSREFIASAKATGVGRARLMQRYLLPNMAEPLVLAGLAYVAGAIIDISGLDFLGLGVQPPAYDWGTLLTAGVQSIYVTPFAGIAPAFMIMLTGTSLVFFGEALSRALNPRLWVTGPRRGGRAERARAGRAGKAGLAGPAFPARPAPAAGAADPVVADPVVADPVVADPVVADAVVADAVVVENLRITLPSGGGPRALVDGVSFRLRAGEVLGIVGESGSGKTLTSLAIGQLLPHPLRATATRIELGGTELTTLPPGRLARVLGTGLAMIFQDPMSSMNPASRAGSQLTDGARRHRGLSREEARAEAVQRLGEVRIGDARRALRRYPHQFSGGMQQRIMIAMGLMARPRVLIADEPTTALDVTVQAQVLEVLRDINASEGTAIILISHNLGVINQLCDRVLVMYAGRVVEEGDRERLLADPQHPYTKALLASVPVLPGTVLSGTSPAAELSTIPGRPPRPDEDVPGCAFAARCPLAVSRCTAERPALSAAAAGGKVACFVVTGATTGEAVR
jgi:oligopeptide/dipeptide ABC transporter ATP-binding protein